MAIIKSALEIALERTEGVEANRSNIVAKQLKIEGRKAALAFLDGKSTAKDIAKSLKKHKGDDQSAFKLGAAESLMSCLKLPADEGYKDVFAKAAEGLAAISDQPSDVEQMLLQLGQFFDQFILNRNQMESQIMAQFEPLMKQKEEAIFAQTGSRRSIDPLDDPEFQKVYSQNMGKLSKSYAEALVQAKGQLKEFLGIIE